MITYYIITGCKVRPVKIINRKTPCGGMFNILKVRCLDGAEETHELGEDFVFNSEKEAIRKVMPRLNQHIAYCELFGLNERLEQLKNRKQEYERKFNNE